MKLDDAHDLIIYHQNMNNLKNLSLTCLFLQTKQFVAKKKEFVNKMIIAVWS